MNNSDPSTSAGHCQDFLMHCKRKELQRGSSALPSGTISHKAGLALPSLAICDPWVLQSNGVRDRTRRKCVPQQQGTAWQMPQRSYLTMFLVAIAWDAWEHAVPSIFIVCNPICSKTKFLEITLAEMTQPQLACLPDPSREGRSRSLAACSQDVLACRAHESLA